MGGNEIVLELSRQEIDALRSRAEKSLEKQGPSAEGAELFRVLVRIDRRDGLAWFNLGDCLRSIGRFREAEDALLTARELAPKTNRFTVDARLGMLFSRKGSPTEAEKWFRLATADSECPGWVWVLRAANLVRKESNKLARECLRAAKLRGDVDLEEVSLNEALIDRCEGDYESAVRNASRALEIDPNFVAATDFMTSLMGATEAKDYVARLAGVSRRQD